MVLIPLAYLTRLIGLSLLIATVVFLVCDSAGTSQVRLRRAIIIGSLAAIPALAWFLFNRWIGAGVPTAYWGDYAFDKVYANRSVLEGTTLLFVHRISVNLPKYTLHAARIIFFPATWVSTTALALPIAAMIFGGFLWCAIRRRTVAEYYIVFYICALLLYKATLLQRYLVPLIPFIWYYFLTASGQLLILGKTHLSGPRHQRSIAWAAAVLLAVLVTANGTVAVLANTIYHGRENYYHVVGEDMYTEVALWAKTHTSPDSVFMWAKPSLRFLSAGRKAVNYPRAHNTDDKLRAIYLQEVDFVVVDRFF